MISKTIPECIDKLVNWLNKFFEEELDVELSNIDALSISEFLRLDGVHDEYEHEC